jgi:hypothetical protein
MGFEPLAQVSFERQTETVAFECGRNALNMRCNVGAILFSDRSQLLSPRAGNPCNRSSKMDWLTIRVRQQLKPENSEPHDVEYAYFFVSTISCLQ